MIIECHQHVFWQGRDDAGLIADLDAQGIELCWIMGWEIPQHPVYPENFAYARQLNPAHVRHDGSHPGIPLGDLLTARDRYPGRFVLGYCPDPAKPNASMIFESAVKMHCVRVCGEWKFRMPFDDPRCLELFHAAGRAKAPVVLHLDVPYLPDAEGRRVYQPAWYGGTVENLERALTACPDTNFVGHAPGFWREISGDADREPRAYPRGPVVAGGRLQPLLERYPNLYADISAGSGLMALKRDPQHAREFIVRYADRLLFGRDYYGGEHQEFLATLDLPAEVREKLMCRNALKLVDPKDGPAIKPSLFKLT